MKKFLVLVLAAGLVAAQSCVIRFKEGVNLGGNWVSANGEIVERNDTLSGNVSGLYVSGPFDVTLVLKEGPVTANVTASSNIIDYVTVKAVDGDLKISMADEVSGISSSDISVVVSMPECDGIIASGSGEVSSDGPLTCEDEFDGSVFGSGTINLASVSCKDADFSISGSGGILAGLEAEDFSGSITGSGQMTVVFAGHSSDVEISCSGSGDIDLSGIDTESLEAKIAGSGGISLEGKAKTAHYQISGSGNIDAKKLSTEKVTSKTTGSGEIISE